MYHHRPIRQKQKRGGYLFPFLALILIGLSVILLFQIFGYFRDKSIKQYEDKVAVNLIAGKAEIKIWGVDQWTSAIDGTVIAEGDGLRTAPGSRAELTFLNGSVIRMDADTQIEFLELKSREALDAANISLVKGQLWVKSTEDNIVRAQINIKTKNIQTSGLNVTYGVDATSAEAVHVLDGVMQISVLDEVDQKKSLETLEVEFGQEVYLTPVKFKAIQERWPVQLLALLADEYRDSEWYRFNRSRDLNRADELTVIDAIKNKKSDTIDEVEESSPVEVEVNVEEAAPVQVLSDMPSPIFTQPSTESVTTANGQVIILGTTDASTAKLEITPFQGDSKSPYRLSKYFAGQTQWSYVASLGFGNLINGENRFSIVATDKNGRTSPPAELRFTHVSSLPPADLSAPKVLKITKEAGGDSYLVEGTIGKGMSTIVINGFPLSRYSASSTTWSYRAAEKFSNLKEGENTYEVYGQDPNGKKTPIETFTIEYKQIVKVKEETVTEESDDSEAVNSPEVSI